MTDYSIILQAGGQSSRMGTDKALLPFMGTTLLGYIIDQVAPLGREIIIISNNPENYRTFDLPVFSDVYQGWGALGGLHAAIHHAPAELCMVLACDMPFVIPAFLEFLVRASDTYDAVIPRMQATGFTEPFRAVYRKTCLPPIESAIEKKKRRVNSFFDQVRVRYVDQNEIETYDPALHTFLNVNTPEDLQAALAIAERFS